MTEKPEMSFIEHLAELRGRMMRSLVALAAITVLAYALFYQPMKEVLVAPLEALDPNTDNIFARYNPVMSRLRPFLSKRAEQPPPDLHGMTATETFMVKIKLSLLGGIILAGPYVLFEIWSFIRAGLLPRERRAVLTYFPLSVALFLTGIAFAYFIATPIALLYMLSVDPDIKPVLMYGPYFRMISMTVAAFGVAFQMPLVAMFLARVGIVSAETLARKWRYAIVLMFVLAAILTPPDPFSQLLLALPLIALYVLGIFLARIAERRRKT